VYDVWQVGEMKVVIQYRTGEKSETKEGEWLYVSMGSLRGCISLRADDGDWVFPLHAIESVHFPEPLDEVMALPVDHEKMQFALEHAKEEEERAIRSMKDSDSREVH